MNAKISVLLTLALLLLVFAGCQNAAPQLQDVPAPVSGQELAPNDTPETIEKTPAPTAETTEAPASAKEITEAEAKQLALQHAGLTEAAVTQLHAEPDRDDGTAHYDVDFRNGDYDYDYEIALDGTVLKHEKEYDPKPAPKATEAKPAETTKPTEDKLTKDEAAQIALDHAGLKQSEVLRLKVEYDLDDGVAKYEVDFEKDRFEYSYEIHAQTGKILDADKEYDD